MRKSDSLVSLPSLFFDRVQYAQAIVDWSIDNSTESTLTGRWTVPYGNIGKHFDVDLQPDSDLWVMVSRCIYVSSDIILSGECSRLLLRRGV